ncbi:MAG: hypothetical protein IPJ81_16960 [Chitinophagaceae bacterium]|nr:hypothetical protein [Chitinophagaceae bacterium]
MNKFANCTRVYKNATIAVIVIMFLHACASSRNKGMAKHTLKLTVSFSVQFPDKNRVKLENSYLVKLDDTVIFDKLITDDSDGQGSHEIILDNIPKGNHTIYIELKENKKTLTIKKKFKKNIGLSISYDEASDSIKCNEFPYDKIFYIE